MIRHDLVVAGHSSTECRTALERRESFSPYDGNLLGDRNQHRSAHVMTRGKVDDYYAFCLLCLSYLPAIRTLTTENL